MLRPGKATMGLRGLLLCATVVMALATAVQATTVHVPSEQPTIQAGIDAAVNGDTVLVAPGTYTGAGNRDITFGGKGIILKSESGPANTTIDCQGLGRAFVLRGSVVSEPIIDGFTIINGDGGHQGGAIECFGFSPTIRHCVFVDNKAEYGGALYFNGEEGKSAAEISSFPTIENCTFIGNSANKEGSVFFSNYGVSIDFSACLLSENMSGGGAPVGVGRGGGTITLSCCDLWANEPGDWIGLLEDQAEINDNFSLSPVLCAPNNGFYGIHEISPLRPENSPCGQLVGAIGVSCNDCFDFDADGWCAIDDNCPHHYNPDQQDADADGLGDVCEDDDDDGVVNADDNCPSEANSDQADLDHDGIGDSCDDDIDGDGYDNESDNCPFHYNPDQADLDQDGTGDACQDHDDDGVMTSDDNCPMVSNPDQEDLDQDGIGDVCDDDIDGDGYENETDNCPLHHNPDQLDSNQDGTGDVCEDADEDGILTGDDNCPTVSNPDQKDKDQDGIGDACDEDIDDDGYPNESDNCPENYNPDQIDLNDDGVGDICCCDRRVGDANGLGGDEPTIGDIATMIKAKFITYTCDGILPCLFEADINYSGGCNPTCDDITIGDMSLLIFYLFATWEPPGGLYDCLDCPEGGK